MTMSAPKLEDFPGRDAKPSEMDVQNRVLNYILEYACKRSHFPLVEIASDFLKDNVDKELIPLLEATSFRARLENESFSFIENRNNIFNILSSLMSEESMSKLQSSYFWIFLETLVLEAIETVDKGESLKSVFDAFNEFISEEETSGGFKKVVMESVEERMAQIMAFEGNVRYIARAGKRNTLKIKEAKAAVKSMRTEHSIHLFREKFEQYVISALACSGNIMCDSTSSVLETFTHIVGKFGVYSKEVQSIFPVRIAIPDLTPGAPVEGEKVAGDPAVEGEVSGEEEKKFDEEGNLPVLEPVSPQGKALEQKRSESEERSGSEREEGTATELEEEEDLEKEEEKTQKRRSKRLQAKASKNLEKPPESSPAKKPATSPVKKPTTSPAKKPVASSAKNTPAKKKQSKSSAKPTPSKQTPRSHKKKPEVVSSELKKSVKKETVSEDSEASEENSDFSDESSSSGGETVEIHKIVRRRPKDRRSSRKRSQSRRRRDPSESENKRILRQLRKITHRLDLTGVDPLAHALDIGNKSRKRKNLHDEDSRAESITWSHSEGEEAKDVKLPEKLIRGSGLKQHRRRWSEEETRNLKKGVKKHGAGNWKQILSEFSFNNRTADKWRTIVGRRRNKKAKTEAETETETECDSE